MEVGRSSEYVRKSYGEPHLLHISGRVPCGPVSRRSLLQGPCTFGTLAYNLVKHGVAKRLINNRHDTNVSSEQSIGLGGEGQRETC